MKRNFPVWLGVIIVFFAGFLIYSILNRPSDTLQPPISQHSSDNQQPSEEQPPITDKSADRSGVQSAPNFTLTNLDSETVSLSDFKGKNVYLNFWASWCGPCKLEMPDLEKISQEYQDKDLVVLAVNVGENQNKVQAFMDANEFSFPVLLDPQGKAAKTYKVSSIPVSIFINEEGIIVNKKIGLMTHSQMKAYISELKI
jgi:thiol-disulfide isomerase/thioredoxin